MLKENCHFYTEYLDMGGRIPCCTRYTQLGKCPCDNCNHFLDKVDAQKIIKKYSDGYDKGYTIGREQGINIGKREILDKIKKLVLKYDDPVCLAYEINFLLCAEHNKEVNNDQIHNNCNTDI